MFPVKLRLNETPVQTESALEAAVPATGGLVQGVNDDGDHVYVNPLVGKAVDESAAAAVFAAPNEDACQSVEIFLFEKSVLDAPLIPT